MGLEDQFYPKTKNPIVNLDYLMIWNAGKIGRAYQELTGNPVDNLIKKTYKVAEYCCKASIFFFLMGARYEHLSEKPFFITPLEEQIASEIAGYSKHASSYARTLILAVIGIELYMANDNFSRVIKGQFSEMFMSGSCFLSGAGLSVGAFSDYVTRADIPEPPAKTVWERAKEKLLSVFEPIPQPAYAPIKYNSE
jgi:hypothetical protein